VFIQIKKGQSRYFRQRDRPLIVAIERKMMQKNRPLLPLFLNTSQSGSAVEQCQALFAFFKRAYPMEHEFSDKRENHSRASFPRFLTLRFFQTTGLLSLSRQHLVLRYFFCLYLVTMRVRLVPHFRQRERRHFSMLPGRRGHH